MAGNTLDYARPGTERPPTAFPAVFPGNRKGVEVFGIVAYLLLGVPTLVLDPMLGVMMFVAAVISALGLLDLRGNKDFLVLDLDHLTVNGAQIRRADVIACERGWNGYRLRLTSGRVVRISLFEMRRCDVVRLEQSLTDYFGADFHGET